MLSILLLHIKDFAGEIISVYGILFYIVFLIVYGGINIVDTRKKTQSVTKRFTTWFRHTPLDTPTTKKDV